VNCQRAEGLLLEAAPEELTPDSDSPLGEHIRTCERCRSKAEAIRAAERGLGESLDGFQPSVSADELLEAAILRERQRWSRNRFYRRAMPVAAAAVLVLALGVSLFTSGPRVTEQFAGQVGAMAEPAQFEAPSNRTAMVLNPGDSDIQIIWLF
jgi:anti-sigma factor RsiW